MREVEQQIRKTRQLPEIDALLRQWGAWVRSSPVDVGRVGSPLGRLYVPPAVFDSKPLADYPGPDDLMLEVEQAIIKLPNHRRRLVRYRYFNGYSIRVIASRMHKGTSTIERWLVRAQYEIQAQVDA